MHRNRLSCVAFLIGTIASFAVAGPPETKVAVPPSKDYSGEPFVVSFMKTSYRFDADGTGSKTFQARARVQTEGGVQLLGRIVLEYDSESERLTFTGRVIKSDGSTVPIPESAAQDMSWPVSSVAPMYTDLRQRHVIVPSLRPGDTLEYETQTDRFVAFAPHQFWLSHDFEKGVIVEGETLRVDVPALAYVNVKSEPGSDPAIEESDGRRVYLWTSSHLEREPAPDPSKGPARAEEEDAAPAVQISTFRSWKEIGDWYAGLEKDKRVPDAAIRDKVADITKGATTEMEKLQAIYDFVAKDFRYVSLSFGIGRYQPHAASMIFANQYGDCKDKHTLLAAMAQAAGLDARAALTSATRKVDDGFPSPAQFDHVVSHVMVGGEEVWLDTTTELAPFRIVLAHVRGKSALVIGLDGVSELTTVPVRALVPNGVVTRVDGVITALGALDAKATLTFHGDADVIGRLRVRSVPQAQWKELMQFMAAGLGTFADVSDIEISDIVDTRRPLEYRFHLTKQNYINRFDTEPELALPLGVTGVPNPSEKTGQKNVDLDAMQTEYHARLQLPPQFKTRLPLIVEQKRDFGEYVSNYVMDGSTLVADRTLKLTVNELPTARLNEFKAFRRTVAGDTDQKVGVQVGDGGAAGEPGEAKTGELLDAANAAFAHGKYQESATLIERAVSLEPEHKTAYNELGRAYLALGDFGRAEKALTKATEIDPFSPNAFNNLGRVYREQEHFLEAEQAFRKQIEIDPLDKWAHRNLGDMLLDRKRYAEAEKELAKAVAVTPGNADLYASLGHAQLSQAKAEAARESFASAIKLSPSPPIWNAVAFSLAENASDLDRAREYAESALRVLSAQLRGTRLDDVKDQHLNSVRLLAACWDTMGWIEFKKGDVESAERYLRSAWQLAQSSVVADHLGQLYERAGKKDEAIEYYAFAALGTHPAIDGREHLAALGGEANVTASLNEHREGAGALRSFELKLPGGKGDGNVFILLAPGGVVEDVRIVSGDDSLRPFAGELKNVSFTQEFPDERDTRIIRKGVLSCPQPVKDGGQKPKAGSAKERKKVRAAAPPAGICHLALMPSELTFVQDETPADR